jgi:hypothetical protein
MIPLQAERVFLYEVADHVSLSVISAGYADLICQMTSVDHLFRARTYFSFPITGEM